MLTKSIVKKFFKFHEYWKGVLWIRHYFLVKLTTPDAGEQYNCILIDLRNDYLSSVFSLEEYQCQRQIPANALTCDGCLLALPSHGSPGFFCEAVPSLPLVSDLDNRYGRCLLKRDIE